MIVNSLVKHFCLAFHSYLGGVGGDASNCGSSFKKRHRVQSITVHLLAADSSKSPTDLSSPLSN